MSGAADLVVTVEELGLRVDACTQRLLALPSRSRARTMIKAGAVLLNGAEVETSRFVKFGDRLTVLPHGAARRVYELPLDVAWMDEHLAVVVKPPGLPVSGNRFRTIQSALPYNLPHATGPAALPAPMPVHRLDARTTGLLVVARTTHGQVGMGRLFQQRRVRKRYRALVVGRLEGEGTVDLPIEGREARSRFRAVEHTPSLHTRWFTTVDLWPETGRTHQLRIHLASLGHPVLGDGDYTDGKVLRSAGMFLCAVQLDFPHPVTGEELRVETPEPGRYGVFRRREERRYAASDDPPCDL